MVVIQDNELVVYHLGIHGQGYCDQSEGDEQVGSSKRFCRMFWFNDSGPMPVLLMRLPAPRDVALPFLPRVLPGHAAVPESRVIHIQSAFDEPAACELKC